MVGPNTPFITDDFIADQTLNKQRNCILELQEGIVIIIYDYLHSLLLLYQRI